eukprot:1809741-Rhodomonas_salina.1
MPCGSPTWGRKSAQTARPSSRSPALSPVHPPPLSAAATLKRCQTCAASGSGGRGRCRCGKSLCRWH